MFGIENYLGFILAAILLNITPGTDSMYIIRWQIYKQGVITNTFNPKVALFFLAFFPQFIDSSYGNSMLSFLGLGLTFASTGFIWCSCLALLASKFSENLRKNPTIEVILNRISGVIFIGMGVKLLTEKG